MREVMLKDLVEVQAALEAAKARQIELLDRILQYDYPPELL